MLPRLEFHWDKQFSVNIKQPHGPKTNPQKWLQKIQHLELLPKITKEKTNNRCVPGKQKAKEMSKKAKAIPKSRSGFSKEEAS